MNENVQKSYNAKVLNAIKQQTVDGNNPKDLDILKQISEKAKILKAYIKNWNHELTTECNGVPTIVPKFIPSKEMEKDPYESKSAYNLCNLEFTGWSILSEGIYALEGKVSFSTKENKFRVQVRCAGLDTQHLTKEHIKFVWDPNCRTIEIIIELLNEEVPSGWEQPNTSFRYGSGTYVAELPDDVRNLRYVKPRKSELYKLLKVNNGVLELELPLQDQLDED